MIRHPGGFARSRLDGISAREVSEEWIIDGSAGRTCAGRRRLPGAAHFRGPARETRRVRAWRCGWPGSGMPAAAFEHVESYLRGVFGFLGVTDLEIVVAEGLQIGPEQREKAMQGALQLVMDLRPATQLRAALGAFHRRFDQGRFR